MVVQETENNETRILTSPNRIDWTAQKVTCNGCISAIASSETLMVAFGEYGTILTSPLVSSAKIATAFQAIKPSRNILTLRLSPSTLFATLPKSLLTIKTFAVIRDITGKKVLESSVDRNQTELAIPITSLPNGRYILEIKGIGQIDGHSFCILR